MDAAVSVAEEAAEVVEDSGVEEAVADGEGSEVEGAVADGEDVVRHEVVDSGTRSERELLQIRKSPLIRTNEQSRR